MQVAIPKEIFIDEQRVALVPQLVPTLLKLGCTLLFEKGAGLGAHYSDQNYQDQALNQSSNIIFHPNAASACKSADIILKVHSPLKEEIALFKENAIVIGLLSPPKFPEQIIALRDRRITSFAMELIPRISRAQTMDALSSQATAAGYKAVLIAANLLDRFFPMLTTAAGTIRPANVLVIGAGVAGLQAIATARRLGAVVKAYDIRSAAREQIESLGAKMINIDVKAEAQGGYARELTTQEQEQQQAVLLDTLKKTEVVICTALIPGKPAPKILTQQMVEAMPEGSVIVDLAAINGGNCAFTQPGETIQHQGITIAGPVNVPSMLARDASNMYAKNIASFLALLIKDGKMSIDWNDNIIAQSVLTHDGKIQHQATRESIEGIN